MTGYPVTSALTPPQPNEQRPSLPRHISDIRTTTFEQQRADKDQETLSYPDAPAGGHAAIQHQSQSVTKRARDHNRHNRNRNRSCSWHPAQVAANNARPTCALRIAGRSQP